MPELNKNSRRSITATHIQRTADVRSEDWNALLSPDDTPFIRHEFLKLLEDTGCVAARTGWRPFHLTLIQEGENGPSLQGVLPLYIKKHSYGEYVFDWAWAHAYQQHGLEYYPKLVSAVPFTPVTSRKLLIQNSSDITSGVFIETVKQLVAENPISSIHALFLNQDETTRFEQSGFLMRQDNQFHWNNSGYSDFADYLERFTSKKRKNIRSERRQVRDAGVTYQWLSAKDSTEVDWLNMFELYNNTILEHGGSPYLNRDFFLELPRVMGEKVLLLRGVKDQSVVCSALYFSNQKTLYGRYWGARGFIPHLHFETCYYQPIEYAISRHMDSFEAGAQGIHKLSRGLAPTTTHSAHWLKHPGFADAVDRYLEMERNEQQAYNRLLNESLPFRQTNPTPEKD